MCVGQSWPLTIAATISLLCQCQIQFHTIERYSKYMHYMSCLLDWIYEA